MGGSNLGPQADHLLQDGVPVGQRCPLAGERLQPAAQVINCVLALQLPRLLLLPEALLGAAIPADKGSDDWGLCYLWLPAEALTGLTAAVVLGKQNCGPRRALSSCLQARACAAI